MHNNGNKNAYLVLYVQRSAICFGQQCDHREGYKAQRLDILEGQNESIKT